ncbi:ABC transporter substrate-binding protein [Chloroflexota bacterium]
MKHKMKSKLLLLPLVFLVLISLIVVSCAPAPAPAPTPTPTAKPEGTLEFAAPSLGKEMYMHWGAPFSDTLLSLAVFETPAYPSVEAEPIPGLAKRWEYSTDYRTFTLWLREGIPWQDGWGEVTADDFKYSMEQVMGEGSVVANKSIFMEAIESMEVKDPYTLVFHLKKPSPDLWFITIVENQNMLIVCKKHLETVGFDEANQNPVGSGPYRLVERRTGDYHMFEALEEHWRVVPEFKYLIIRAVPEESTRVAMLKSGQIDATTVGSTSIPEIPKEGFKVSLWPGSHWWMMFGGVAVPEDKRYVEGYHNQDPWADVRVREAMNIAIDREAINQAVELGTAAPIPICWPIPGWEELEPYPYDPKRAKQLLTEAGYPDGFSYNLINMVHPGVPTAPKVGEAVAGYWEEIGLTVKIVPMEFPVWYPTAKELENAGNIWSIKYNRTADYATKISRITPNGPMAIWQDAELTRLGEKLWAEIDLEKRNPIWREMAKHFYDSYTTIPLFFVPVIVASNSQKVGEWPPSWTCGFYYNFEYARHAEPLNTWRLFDL